MRRFILATMGLFVMVSTILAQFGDGQGEYIFPVGIAIDVDGNTYITELGNDRVQKLNASQEWMANWGRFGSDSLEFNDPIGIAVSADGDILVNDSGNHRIVVYDPDGRCRCIIALPDSSVPWGLAAANGFLYVTDLAQGTVDVLTMDGRLVGTVGQPGHGEGQLDKPRGVALDGDGRIWVVDAGNDRVQVFSPDGQQVRSFGAYGDGDGEFDSPSGIAVTGQGQVLVTDTGNDRFQEFDLDGAFKSQAGSSGTDPVQFLNPTGIAVDAAGNLYIVDTDNHRVQVLNAQ